LDPSNCTLIGVVEQLIFGPVYGPPASQIGVCGVGLAEGTLVGVLVGVAVFVGVDVGVLVQVGVGVFVGLGVLVTVGDGEQVAVGVGVGTEHVEHF
jgi:hypothetical protein